MNHKKNNDNIQGVDVEMIPAGARDEKNLYTELLLPKGVGVGVGAVPFYLDNCLVKLVKFVQNECLFGMMYIGSSSTIIQLRDAQTVELSIKDNKAVCYINSNLYHIFVMYPLITRIIQNGIMEVVTTYAAFDRIKSAISSISDDAINDDWLYGLIPIPDDSKFDDGVKKLTSALLGGSSHSQLVFVQENTRDAIIKIRKSHLKENTKFIEDYNFRAYPLDQDMC
jgi:hypothetical protein